MNSSTAIVRGSALYRERGGERVNRVNDEVVLLLILFVGSSK